MVIVISIHQVADKSVFWKQAAQATKFGAIWLQLIGQEVWQKLSYFFDQLLNPLKSLRNPSDLVCSRNYYILWYKFQKFKKWKKILGYALRHFSMVYNIHPNWVHPKIHKTNCFQRKLTFTDSGMILFHQDYKKKDFT